MFLVGSWSGFSLRFGVWLLAGDPHLPALCVARQGFVVGKGICYQKANVLKEAND